MCLSLGVVHFLNLFELHTHIQPLAIIVSISFGLVFVRQLGKWAIMACDPIPCRYNSLQIHYPKIENRSVGFDNNNNNKKYTVAAEHMKYNARAESV